VRFSFAAPSASLSEGAPPLDVLVVLHTSLAATEGPTSVSVIDRGTGSATAGSDYPLFAPRLLEFPAGSVDGATLSVPFSATGDLRVEGLTETVRLGLSEPNGAGIQGPATMTLSIQDVDTATIQFASAASDSGDESSGPRPVPVALGLAPGVQLDIALHVLVSDTGNGSASSGSDYAHFAPQTISFPAGSADGAVQQVELQVQDDTAIEIDETVELGLSLPSAGASIGATALHQLTIQDDDTPASAALIATEGPTGVENPLAYDQLVDLGSQTVGAGPNTGTRVRISNAGGSPMDLGAPRLAGTNPNDFSVTVESAPLAPPPGPEAQIQAPAAERPSPLLRSGRVGGPGIALELDRARLAELAALPRATLRGFPLPGLGDVTLSLRQLPLPLAPDARLRIDGVDVEGGVQALLGDLSIWSGSLLEVPGSRVFLALSSTGSRGFLELPRATDHLLHLVPDAGGSGACRILGGADLAALGLEAPALVCAEERRVPSAAGPNPIGAAVPLPAGTQSLQVVDCRIAIETDYQLFQKFNSTSALTSYVTQLMAAVSAQYFEDVQTTLSIAYLGIHSNASDGWTSQDSGGSPSALLDEFIAAWAPNNWPVQANLAHFLSGASLGGGVAYIDVLCNQSFGFGVSGNISGNIDWGAWNGQPASFTWDFVVVAHEIGHNFGSDHTHSYCPPLDQCAPNCSGTTVCSQGTLMSYCHLCGGMDNIDLVFHPVCANIMRQAVNSSCLGLSALAAGDYVQYLVRFNPLTSTGQRNATLEFDHDAPNETQPFRVRLRGTGN
jgi:hypothetical protein